MATASTGGPVLQYCVKLLVPGMITFIAKVASFSDEPEKQKIHVSAVEEILKALVSLFQAVPERSRMFFSYYFPYTPLTRLNNYV